MNNLDLFEVDQTNPVHVDYKVSLQTHIKYVREAGKELEVSKAQLEVHDMSKWTIHEFPFYAKHFHGGGDPDGFAGAWLHHLQHNPHHWQHYIFPDDYHAKDSSMEGPVMEMPQPFALEMVADWMGSSMTYTGYWDMQDWLVKNMPRIRLHSKTAIYVREVLGGLGYDLVYTTPFARELAYA